MRTMHPVLKRGGLFWDRDLLPPAAYHERFRRTQALIADAGDDAWLVYGDVEKYGALAWFSNFLPRTRSALALAPRSGDPTLLVSVGQRDVPAAKTLTWIDDVRPFSRLSRTLVGLVEEKGLQSARLGLVAVDELMPVTDARDIAKALPLLRTASRTRDIAMLRARKDACEIEAVRRTAAIVAGGLDIAARVIAAGKPMRAVTAEIDRHIRANAAEDVRILCASGEQTASSLRPADDRIPRAGDVVMIYVAAEVQRYWAEAARTFVVGRASDALREFAARAEATLAAMRAAVVPGAAARSVAHAARSVENGGPFHASALAYGLGGGIGLDAEELPLFAPDGDDEICDDSTLALRVIAHADGIGIALAETILLRSGRIERLTGMPGLIECAA